MHSRSAPPLAAAAGGLRPAASGRLALWLRATRPLYIPTSLVPAVAGALVAIGVAGSDWWLLPVALVALLLVHAGTNVCNDVEDAAHGVDPPDKADNSQVFSRGLLTIGEGRRLYAVLFAAAFALGLAMSAVQGPVLLGIGLAGILGGWLYTGGPRPYKYDGIGDPLIVLLLGPLLTQGAYTAVTGDGFDARAFWLGMAPGLLVTSVVAGNNLADLEGDRAAGLRTLPVRLGFRRARTVFLAMLVGAVAVPVALWASGLFGAWILLPLLVTPLAAGRVRQALRAGSAADDTLCTLAPRTAQLHLLFSVLLCIGVLLDRV